MTAPVQAATGPLAGVRVLDLTSVVLGPYASMVLGDWGAEVIKVEPPEGDTTRLAGHQRNPHMGSVFLTMGRNKRSLCLDLKAPQAGEVLTDLARSADVFLHNMRAPAAAKLGITHADIAAVNPAVVHATAAGFDPSGRYAGKPAYDDMIQGLCGVVSLMERIVGEPAYVPMILVDKTVGLTLANAVIAALFHRERTGEGQAVTVPMFEVMSAFTLLEHLWDATFDPEVGPPGYVRVLSRMRRPYATADGHVCALPYQDKHFQAFFGAVGREDLASDPRFGSIPARLAHIDDVYATVGEITAAQPTSYWLELFDRLHIPAVRVNTLEDLLADPHLGDVGFFQRVDHPTEGSLRMPGTGVRFAASPESLRRPAPHLGEHNREVLTEIGYRAERVAELEAAGVLRSSTA